MNYFAFASGGHPPYPRFHPLLCSLSEAINESETAPNIGTVSEDDPRALRSNFYTSPNDLPSLDIVFDDECGVAQSAAHDSRLIVGSTWPR